MPIERELLAQLQIDRGLLAQLDVNHWLSSDPVERARLGGALAMAITKAGRRMHLDRREGTFPRLHDAKSKALFVIVPSGEFCPGISAAKRERFDDLFHRLGAGEHPRPYLSDEAPFDASWFFAAGRPVAVGPLLLSEKPGGAMSDAELTAHLAAKRLELPTGAELEWVARRSGDALFPWGDELPDWLIKHARAHAVESLSAAARSCGEGESIGMGAFGVLEPVTLTQWCVPSERNDAALSAAFPLGFRGGAGYCAPWQGANEYLHWLSACEVRQAPGSYRAHRLRSAIHLAPR